MVIDGFGPPRSPAADDPGQMAASGRAEVEHRLAPDHQSKPMATVQEAADRLAKSNPKLDRGEALRLAEYGTQAVDGGVKWAFDVKAQQIWSSFSHRDSKCCCEPFVAGRWLSPVATGWTIGLVCTQS